MVVSSRPHAPSPATAAPACQTGDDDVEEGDDGVDDGCEDGADSVDDGHQAVANRAEDGFNLDCCVSGLFEGCGREVWGTYARYYGTHFGGGVVEAWV